MCGLCHVFRPDTTAGPWPSCSAISGAMCFTLPHAVCERSPLYVFTLAKPLSLSVPSAASSTFSRFRSRCISKQFWWRCSMGDSICATQMRISSGESTYPIVSK